MFCLNGFRVRKFFTGLQEFVVYPAVCEVNMLAFLFGFLIRKSGEDLFMKEVARCSTSNLLRLGHRNRSSGDNFEFRCASHRWPDHQRSSGL